jgi:hypothetical protein
VAELAEAGLALLKGTSTGTTSKCKKKALAKAKEAAKEALAKAQETKPETKDAEEAPGVTDNLMKAGFASLDEGGGQQQEASRTQGMLPGAQEASPTEEDAIEPAMAGQDKEGAQSLSMASTG